MSHAEAWRSIINMTFHHVLLCMFLQPTVCERELCVFAFQTLGVMNEAADEIATGAQVRIPVRLPVII